jgi:hypothetical protein
LRQPFGGLAGLTELCTAYTYASHPAAALPNDYGHADVNPNIYTHPDSHAHAHPNRHAVAYG